MIRLSTGITLDPAPASDHAVNRLAAVAQDFGRWAITWSELGDAHAAAYAARQAARAVRLTLEWGRRHGWPEAGQLNRYTFGVDIPGEGPFVMEQQEESEAAALRACMDRLDRTYLARDYTRICPLAVEPET